ncbi:MAG: hypothetical protein GX649_00380 [Chloroflexi bacterium]|nr:hypothetical protein [Chloroflexota bacterium]
MHRTHDQRHIVNGCEIPTETYADQPYVVRTDDGAWLCVVTTGPGHEGQAGQHVVTRRSTDRGRTWEDPVDVEPPGPPEASYAVLLKAPGGRVYCFYNHNSDNLRAVRADSPPYADGLCRRVDSQGHFVCKYSDDHGRSWSARRYEVPIREMAIDRQNPYGGEVQFFWNVGKPFLHDGAAYVSVHKVGGFGEGFFTRSEGVLLKSANLLTERDPERIAWETLPDGDAGLRTPPGGGPIAEEQSYSVLSDGSFFCVYRTIDGHPACAYSRDGGRTWTEPQYLRYADGRLIKHPRAAVFCWRCANGRYLLWFHNHGGRSIREHPQRRTMAYQDRNPVWLCGGLEADTPAGKVIRWSQPEIALYDDDPMVRISYPDLVEEGGQYYLTETQKDTARVHEVDPVLLQGLWEQDEASAVAEEGLLLSLPEGDGGMPGEAPMPAPPVFLERDGDRSDQGTRDLRGGLTLDLWVRLDALEAGQVLLDNRTPSGQGFCLQTTDRGTAEIVLHDGHTENRWECDPGVLDPGRRHHLVVIVDGGPKVIVWVVDGRLCDGGEARPFGWGRYSPHLRGVQGAETLRIGPGLRGAVESLRIYGRALRTSEAVGNWRVGLG